MSAKSEDILDLIVAGRLRDPTTGRLVKVGTRSVVVRESLDGSESNLVSSLGLGPRIAVVADPDTDEALGLRVRKALAGAFQVCPVLLGRSPTADSETVRGIREQTRRADAIAAVGAGTINDLCKQAAHLDRKPYVVFATAPSMNGFVSENASIAIRGVKKSIPAAAPLGAFFDLSVLAESPRRLIQAGLGDILCRPTAQADWLLSHLLFATPYAETPFSLVAAEEKALFASSEALLRGDLAAVRSLSRVLLLSGFGMAICGTSAPASQGEHLITHYLEMFWPGRSQKPFHGEQVGVATLTMAGLQQRVLASGSREVFAETLCVADFVDRFGDERGHELWREFGPKCLTLRKAEALEARLASGWDAIRAAIEPVSRSREFLYSVIMKAEGPTRPDQLGITAEFYNAAVRDARLIRNRFTFLDLAAATRLLGEAV